MPTTEKANVIEQTRDWYSRAQGIVFTDYRGLQVKDMQTLRKQLRAKGAEIHVIKNTLFRQAAGDDVAQFPEEYHNGTTAIAFLFQNESEGAKVLHDFAVSSKKLVIKGGYFGGRTYDAKGVEAIGKLPPRDVLIAQVIGTIVAPLTQLVGTIEAIYAQPIRTIYAAADSLGAAPSEAPAAEPAAVPEPEAQETPAAEVAEPTSVQTDAGETPVEAPAETTGDAPEQAPAEAPAEETADADAAPEEPQPAETASEENPE